MSDFISQLPPIFLILGCALPLLLVASVAGLYMTQNRGSKPTSQAEKERVLAMATGPSGQRAGQSDEPAVTEFASDASGEADPLDELFRAREEASQQSESPQPNAAGAVPDRLAEVEDDVTLADLLSSMGESSPRHTVTDETLTVELHTGDTVQAQEMLSILRDEADGRLMVQVGQQAYRTLVDSPDAKKHFTRIMKELSQVILKPDSRSTAKPESEPEPELSPPPVEPKPESATDTPASAPPAPDVPVQADETSASLRKEAARLTGEADKIPGLLPDYTIDDDEEVYERGRFGRVKIKKPQEDVPELNIAEAINEYLQYRLTQTDEFKNRDIVIRPALNGGVQIFVDKNSYDFVDEIEDAGVRDFVRATIDEWQEHH